jgi:aminoglycoside phosphotransferase (APT) family kinase protein
VDGGRVPALVDSDADGATIGRPYMLIELVPGETLEKVLPTLDPEEKRAMLEEVGEVVGTLHAHVGTGGFGWHGTAPSWSTGLMEMFESLLADRTDLNIELDAPNEQIFGLVENAAQLLDEVDQPDLVHWDLGEPNILVDRQDGEYRVSGIIDWERALWGDPDCDLACFQHARSSFWTRYWRGAPEGRRAIRQQVYRLFFWTVMLVEEPLRFPGADHIPLIRAMWTNDWNGLSDLREGS